jgi:GH25 family lysozyme M1 (1,4-beta-N-acetylmuramidase)
MLDVEGNIKLIDFGCAKRLKKNQNTHSMRQILKSMKGLTKKISIYCYTLFPFRYS